jgi:phage baseplate assembly protein V
MLEGLIETAATAVQIAARRIYGVAVAEVIANVDATGLGRVQVRFPWLPGIEPWARVATLFAGPARGSWFIPQPGDEVLVAFHHGDIREPYVVGALWNGRDRPPAAAPTDATGKRILRTPRGHEIVFDDDAQSITITSATRQTITMTPQKIEMATEGGKAKVTVETAGRVAVASSVAIELKAPSITLDGKVVDVNATATATLNGDTACTIRGGVVSIN